MLMHMRGNYAEILLTYIVLVPLKNSILAATQFVFNDSSVTHKQHWKKRPSYAKEDRRNFQGKTTYISQVSAIVSC